MPPGSRSGATFRQVASGRPLLLSMAAQVSLSGPTGSFCSARHHGEMTKDSDIDLSIVEPAPRNRHEEAVRIRECHWEYRLSSGCAHYGDGAF